MGTASNNNKKNTTVIIFPYHVHIRDLNLQLRSDRDPCDPLNTCILSKVTYIPRSRFTYDLSCRAENYSSSLPLVSLSSCFKC